MTSAVPASGGDGMGPIARLAVCLDRVVMTVSGALAVLSLVAMFLALMAEVVVRYITHQGMDWPSELPNILFPWLVMGGVVLAAQRGQHVAVTAVHGMLGRKAIRVLMLALQVLLTLTFFYLAYVGFEVLEVTGAEEFPVTGITAFWAYLAFIAGFVGLGLTALTTIVHLLTYSDPLTVRAAHPEEGL